MFELADTTFRAYKKKDGRVSLHCRGYLLVHTNAGFRLDAYLRDIHCWLTLPKTKEHECDSVAFSYDTQARYDGQTMLHDIFISTVTPFRHIETCVANMKMKFHLSFTGHATEEPTYMERRVPIIKRYRGK